MSKEFNNGGPAFPHYQQDPWGRPHTSKVRP